MFVIKNVKISLKLKEISLNSVLRCLDVNNTKYKTKSNYIIIESKYIYIIFRPKNHQITHINVTKIPNLSEIDVAVNILRKEIFPILNISINQTNIDNLTAVYNANKNIVLPEIIKHKKDYFKITYNNEKFPGMFVKFDVGTLIIFYTGKVIAVGCKTVNSLEYLFEELNKFLK